MIFLSVADVYCIDNSPPINQFVDTASFIKFRSLDFMTNNLGDDIDLVLLFEPPKVGKLYVDVFPVCWRVLSFSAIGIGLATVEYTGDSGFVVPEVESSGSRIVASNAQHCEIGQKCTLKTNANGNLNYLTSAIDSASPNVMQCLNGTERPARIGAGYFNRSGTKIEPVFLWDGIAKGSMLSINPSTMLKIYAVSGYQGTIEI
ncbi:hypothetical protein CVT25_003784 [Psilocybe cyanescens]|uniref:Uncharacterized protein n=1 Tax=Psilocybe cyanescens TaxID=93625 RepID=A0A409W7M5_PSICY|nr:hypothetical protein CVT25_003784 [Psilocybe cyanescens]